jgi:hypothetical protein
VRNYGHTKLANGVFVVRNVCNAWKSGSLTGLEDLGYYLTLLRRLLKPAALKTLNSSVLLAPRAQQSHVGLRLGLLERAMMCAAARSGFSILPPRYLRTWAGQNEATSRARDMELCEMYLLMHAAACSGWTTQGLARSTAT